MFKNSSYNIILNAFIEGNASVYSGLRGIFTELCD